MADNDTLYKATDCDGLNQPITRMLLATLFFLIASSTYCISISKTGEVQTEYFQTTARNPPQ